MSNIPANNPHNSVPDSSQCCDDSDEPEPASGESFQVLTVWDDSVLDQRKRFAIDDNDLKQAANLAAALRGYHLGEIGIRVTDDQTIHQINREFLSHDYPTDVISFAYCADGDRIEGELVASIETAESNAVEAGWETARELLLYVIHGVLHIGGMDDRLPADRRAMRDAETTVLGKLGIQRPGESCWDTEEPAS